MTTSELYFTLALLQVEGVGDIVAKKPAVGREVDGTACCASVTLKRGVGDTDAGYDARIHIDAATCPARHDVVLPPAIDDVQADP